MCKLFLTYCKDKPIKIVGAAYLRDHLGISWHNTEINATLQQQERRAILTVDKHYVIFSTCAMHSWQKIMASSEVKGLSEYFTALDPIAK